MVKSDTESDKTTDYNDVANTEDFKDEVHVFLLGQRATYICLTSVTRAKCGIRSTLCWKVGNTSGPT